MVKIETSADYTYKPTINKMSQAIKSEQPAHIRLREKGKEYQMILEKKKVEAAIYDSSGRKLFLPQRHVRKSSPVESEMEVDEYLYRDAQVRLVLVSPLTPPRVGSNEGNSHSKKRAENYKN
jgi:hypothetical protein